MLVRSSCSRFTRRCAAVAALTAALSLAGCAAPGRDYPSLLPRPFESTASAPQPVVTPPAAPLAEPLPAAVQAQLARALAAHESGAAAFAAALATARSQVDAARGVRPGGEAWAVAQQALSRLGAARGGSVGALADLDRIQIAQAEAEQQGAAPAGGAERIDTARAPVAAAVAEQRAALQALTAALAD